MLFRSELVFAFALGIILIPIELIIALAVAATSSGPVIYRQTRIGESGASFMLYKFRTMRADAERDGSGSSPLIHHGCRYAHWW